MTDILQAAQNQTTTPIEENKIMESILSAPSAPAPEEPVLPAVPPPQPQKEKKKRKNGILIASLFLLVLALPIGVYVLSQNRQVADIRSSAASEVNRRIQESAPHTSSYTPICTYDCRGCAERSSCHAFDDDIPRCRNTPGCVEDFGRCSGDYCTLNCNVNHSQTECQQNNNCTWTAQCLPTPTPIPQPPLQCLNIKVYKDNVQVDPATLVQGDTVVLAVNGQSATKGRIRINGGSWTESATTNSNGEYTATFTIPAGVTNFTIEAEVYKNGAWQ